MKAVLICPAERAAVAELAGRDPLVLAPLLGQSPLEYWVESLAARGVEQVTILAADRPNRLRDRLGDGKRWGVRLEIVPTAHELTPDEARARSRRDPDPKAPDLDVIVVDHLPGQPEFPLFESYAGWFAALRAWMPHAVTAGRIGMREVMPGVWISGRAEIDRTARLVAPCWVGDYARIGADVTVGPGAIIDDRALVEPGARVVEGTVGPDTYVGRFVSIERSLAHGPLLIHWTLNSSVQVPDPFLLADLSAATRRPRRTTVAGRAAAGLAMLATAPIAAGVVALSLMRGEAPWQLRLGLRHHREGRHPVNDTFAYYELGGARNWLRRWPQFWSVVRGDMAWIGNRPLRPTQAMTLASDFERLWLSAPVGLISLADAHGCPDGISDAAIAHASYYAVHASGRLDWFILGRTLVRAAAVWPIHGHRRRDAAVPLESFVPKQEV